jgi:hypothetical protein
VETGVRLAICDSQSLATVVLLNESRSQRYGIARKADPGFGFFDKKRFLVLGVANWLYWSVVASTATRNAPLLRGNTFCLADWVAAILRMVPRCH